MARMRKSQEVVLEFLNCCKVVQTKYCRFGAQLHSIDIPQGATGVRVSTRISMRVSKPPVYRPKRPKWHGDPEFPE